MHTIIFRFKKHAFLLVLASVLTGLTGCDQVRTTLSGVIQPRTAQDALNDASQAFASGHYQRAIDEATPFASTPGELQPRLALLVSRAYAMSGATEKALSFLSLAAQPGALDRPSLMLDPAFASMHTDLRFVSFVAGLDAQDQLPPPAPTATRPAVIDPPARPAPTDAAAAAEGPGVSVRLGPDGVSATAGGVSARVNP